MYCDACWELSPHSARFAPLIQLWRPILLITTEILNAAAAKSLHYDVNVAGSYNIGENRLRSHVVQHNNEFYKDISPDPTTSFPLLLISTSTASWHRPYPF